MLDKDKYLFKGLLPGGPDDKRYVVRLEGLRTLQEQRRRKGAMARLPRPASTFMAMMEGEEVPESTLKLVVGHQRESMTYGLYSKGQRVKLRSVVVKVDYGPKVMEALKAACNATKEASSQTPYEV